MNKLVFLLVLKYCLRLGLLNSHDIKNWADKLLTNSDEFDDYIINISMSKESNELLSELNKIIGFEEAILRKGIDCFFHLLFLRLKEDPSQWRSIVFLLLSFFDNVDQPLKESEERFLKSLHSDVDLRSHGLSPNLNLALEIEIFLSDYKDCGNILNELALNNIVLDFEGKSYDWLK